MRVLLLFCAAVLATVHGRVGEEDALGWGQSQRIAYQCTPCKCASKNGYGNLLWCQGMWKWDPTKKYKYNGLCRVLEDGIYQYTGTGTCPEGSPQPPVPKDPKRVFGKNSFQMSECRSGKQFHSEIVRNNQGTNTLYKCAGWCDSQVWNGDQADACQFSGKDYDQHCKAIWSDKTLPLGLNPNNVHIFCSDGVPNNKGWKCQWGTSMDSRTDVGKKSEDDCRAASNNGAYTWYHGNGQCYTYPNGIHTPYHGMGQWFTNGNRDWKTCRHADNGDSQSLAMADPSSSVTVGSIVLYGFAALGCGVLFYGAGKHFFSKN